jgi:hypothetical protein
MLHAGLLEKMEILNNKIQNPSPKGVCKLKCPFLDVIMSFLAPLWIAITISKCGIYDYKNAIVCAIYD